jgi:hypothetical protein
MLKILGKVLFVLIVMALCFWPTWFDLVAYHGLSGMWQHYTASLGLLACNGVIQLIWIVIGLCVIGVFLGD